MIFVTGIILIVIAFLYANFVMSPHAKPGNWTDAFFGLVALIGGGCIVTSFAILAYNHLP